MMSSQPPIQPQAGIASQQPQIQMVTVSKDFNLRNYISNYSGHGKIRRLIFIADHVKELESEALNMLAAELKSTSNVQLYKVVTERAGVKAERDWMDNTDKKANWTLEKLEQDLNTAKVNLAKENIRVLFSNSFYLLMFRGCSFIVDKLGSLKGGTQRDRRFLLSPWRPTLCFEKLRTL